MYWQVDKDLSLREINLSSASSDFNVPLNTPFLKTAFCYLPTLCFFSSFLTFAFSPLSWNFFPKYVFSCLILTQPVIKSNTISYESSSKEWIPLLSLLLLLLWFVCNSAFITVWLSVYSFSAKDFEDFKGRKWVRIYACPRLNGPGTQ